MPAFSDPALIVPGAVGEDELADGAVTTAKVKAGDDLIAAAPHTGHVVTSIPAGYAGDNSVNRAIPHGYSGVPLYAWVYQSANGRLFLLKGTKQIDMHSAITTTVTAMDATNIYVSKEATAGGANNGGISYELIVVGVGV